MQKNALAPHPFKNPLNYRNLALKLIFSSLPPILLWEKEGGGGGGGGELDD